MDETDILILKNLIYNSRLTFRELAELTNMSLSAIYKRIKYLEDDNIINTYIARPSIFALKYLVVIIFGTSNAKSLDAVSNELGKHECINNVGIAGGKFLYCSVFLKNMSELQDLSSFVSRTGQISEPTVGIVNIPYMTTHEPLTSTDYKILKTLNRDARKSTVDVADDTGFSVKTVKKRLDRMVENNLAEFTIEWTPLAENSFISVFHLVLNEGTDINSKTQHISENYSLNMISCTNFSNIPNLIILATWTKTARDSQQIQEKLQTEGFKNIIPYIILDSKNYDCWLDHFINTK